MAKFVIRLDDITPTMRWSSFESVAAVARSLSIKPLVGIVPANADPQLVIQPERRDFWDRVRALRGEGWTISQHGYKHVFDSKDPGLLKMGNFGEFAGHPRGVQLERLAAGQAILAKQALPTDVFMPPAHNFDRVTLDALRETGFRYLSDGYGLWPYQLDGLTFVPQLFATPKQVGAGVYTVCVHLNKLSQDDLARLITFMTEKRGHIISFYEAAQLKSPEILGRVSRVATRGVRQLERRVTRRIGRR